MTTTKTAARTKRPGLGSVPSAARILTEHPEWVYLTGPGEPFPAILTEQDDAALAAFHEQVAQQIADLSEELDAQCVRAMRENQRRRPPPAEAKSVLGLPQDITFTAPMASWAPPQAPAVDETAETGAVPANETAGVAEPPEEKE